MSGFVLHPGAFADLDEIWEFIAADNVMAADRVLDEILEAIRSLVSFPRMGHSRPELTSHPLRFHPVRDFVVVYARMKSRSWSWPYSTAAAILALSPPFCATENSYATSRRDHRVATIRLFRPSSNVSCRKSVNPIRC